MSMWDDLTGRTASDASNAAAADTYGKQRAATGAYRDYGNRYAADYRDLSKGYDPYVGAGNDALKRLQMGLGLGGPGSTADFTNAYRSTPGYTAALETGTNAALRNVNASGMSNSGAALKALARYGQGFEDQQSGNYLSRLSNLAGTGLSATGAQIGTVGQGLEGQRNIEGGAFQGDYGAADTIGQGMVAGAEARQRGTQGLLNTAAYLGGKLIPSFPSFGGGNLGTGGMGLPKGMATGGLYADGGRPPVGQPSFVGERGPEMFVPDTPGTIVPNETLAPMAASAQRQPVAPPLDGTARPGSNQDFVFNNWTEAAAHAPDLFKRGAIDQDEYQQIMARAKGERTNSPSSEQPSRVGFSAASPMNGRAMPVQSLPSWEQVQRFMQELVGPRPAH